MSVLTLNKEMSLKEKIIFDIFRESSDLTAAEAKEIKSFILGYKVGKAETKETENSTGV